MSVRAEFVEKPPHIDQQRMRHISDEDFFAALDLTSPGLANVRAAVDRSDWPAAYDAWATYFANREGPEPVVNKAGYADFLRETGDPRVLGIIEEAQQLHTIEVDYTDRAKGKSGLYGFHYMRWLMPLIDAYALTGDEEHVHTFVRLFNQWYETRDQVRGEWPMDVIWYTLGLGIRSSVFMLAYHTFRYSAVLDWQTHARLLKTFLGAARWLAEEHDAFRYGNWQHHGATGLFELGTFWPEFREAAAWAELAWQRLLEHLELDVYADGGHIERAPSYHVGVLDGFRRAALAAERGWHQRLQEHPRFHQMYRWLLAQSTPLGTSTNFNDSGLVSIGPHMVYGAVLFRDPEFKWLADQLGSPQEIASTLASLPHRPDGQRAADVYRDLPSRAPQFTSCLLPSSKFAIMRSGWQAQDRFMAISYGPYIGHELESHSHFDTLSFVCTGDGVPLAIEAGGPSTYDDPLYYDWYRAACAHNVVTVDGENPVGEEKDAELLIWSATPIADCFQAAHDGYRRTKQVRHRRTICFLRKQYWVIHDELEQEQLHDFAWHLSTPQDFSLEDGVLMPRAAPGLVVVPVGPEPVKTDIVSGTMVVPGPAAYTGTFDRREVRGVRYSQQSDASRTIFLTILCPVASPAEIRAITAAPLAVQGDSGEACMVQTPEGQDMLVVANGSSTGLRQVGAWASDARVWATLSDGSWVGYQISHLDHLGKSIFGTSFPLESVAVWPEDGGLAGEAIALRKTTVRLAVDEDGRQVTLNGIVMPPQRDPDSLSFELPAPGQYRFAIK